MRVLQRKPVHKAASASNFRHHVSQTHRRNVSPPPRRGGWRL